MLPPRPTAVISREQQRPSRSPTAARCGRQTLLLEVNEARQLDLPADTEYLGELRAVLSAGHTNHFRSPQAWTEALQARP
ncbi:hypothetical protein SCOCK_60228 [Actinacidiphila cocklensis]|uniref:Uncharacterized protein n=1 Tax=Actinacidiphila cocklensis TaxID=887465 RepID=A0A9W4DXC7_9ACTN|nr:hypothetical protein SCOCK_60228 [Actinacidiphila cocklensis]